MHISLDLFYAEGSSETLMLLLVTKEIQLVCFLQVINYL